MTNDTDDMRQARRDLELFTANDPAAAANMMRYVVAYALMVTGRRGRERRDGEPQIGGGFVLQDNNLRLKGAAVRQSGTDYVYISFDVDDACAPPVATAVIGERGGNMLMLGNCRLWSPANDGRALLVPMPIGGQGYEGYIGYFAFRPNKRLQFIEGAVPGDLRAGFRRAEARLERLLASDALRDVHREGYMFIISNKGNELFADFSRLAA